MKINIKVDGVDRRFDLRSMDTNKSPDHPGEYEVLMSATELFSGKSKKISEGKTIFFFGFRSEDSAKKFCEIVESEGGIKSHKEYLRIFEEANKTIE